MNTTNHAPPSLPRSGPLFAGLLLTLAATLTPEAAIAAAKLKIKAAWSDKTGTLTVKGSAKGNSGPVDVYDINGRRLGSGEGSSFALTLGRQDIGNVPCAVRIEADGTEAIKLVKRAPKSCAGAPACSIVSPGQGTAVQAGADTHFEATATAKDPAAQPFSYEWDFAGGAMGELIAGSNPPAYKRPDTLSTRVQFVRNDSRYRVRFIATDAKGRRCEDSVEVTVGNPPAGLPAKVAEQEAPKLGSELDGAAGDVVVLPFQEWTYQNLSDMKLLNNGWSSANPAANNIRAYAYRKDRLPVLLGPADVELRYSAASNPSDPVGADSINSTSRNWPTTASLLDAALKKSDWWDIPVRTDDGEKASTYAACSWMMVSYWGYWGCPDAAGLGFPTLDEGPFKAKKDESGQIVADDHNTELGHGAYMPGRDNPYLSNVPQPFSRYEAPDSLFEANLLPLAPIDDQGRVNPFPLIRVEAVTKGTDSVVAKTDTALNVTRDLHCRECHAKGEIAANPAAPYTSAAFHSGAWGKESEHPAHDGPPHHRPEKPDFFDPPGAGLEDQEYGAALNYSSLHEFYDSMKFLDRMLNGQIKGMGHGGGGDPSDPDLGKVLYDTPRQCYGCHATMMNSLPFGMPMWDAEAEDTTDPAYAPNYSIAMHRFHGELQYNAGKTDIVRDATGRFVRWDWKSKGQNPNTLFPVKDASGKSLPMEENCLKCHAGKREKCYRDRMETAGVTCYDCHGDMLAVGQAFPKKGQDGLGGDGKRDFNEYRHPWFDEPDCGSCHTGKGSEPVRKVAFDENDPSATPFAVDPNDPDSIRFAVVPVYEKAFEIEWWGDYDREKHDWNLGPKTKEVKARVFREGKDSHGKVACAACHGAAHGVWPNRDPSANDNLTALQLQGHTGTILECNVCHTADSFARKDDLDGGQYSGDAKPGILGGPHNTHPVNDPYWWKQADGDSANSDGTTYGGWHNDYAKLPGAKGEDQCAACHGGDHKGTRLSKTPVDRVFDFRGFDGKKLKKAGFKAKVVKVAAGTPIGCDTCHSLETSFIGSPGR
ncbi:MAG: multiheme c-type cytochrome [Pseudomonadota bacterium]